MCSASRCTKRGTRLGLGHSDSPADVMYPYYRMVTGLGPGDIAAIQKQYAAATVPGDPGMPPLTPLALTIQSPPATTSASSVGLSGTTSGGSGTVQVSWSTNQGATGMAQGGANWTIAAIPLSVGANVITVTARDSKQDQALQSVTVTSASRQILPRTIPQQPLRRIRLPTQVPVSTRRLRP